MAAARARLVSGFAKRWQSKRDARGNLIGDMWPGLGKHAARADAIARAYADKPDALEQSLDAFFASTKPIVADARWSFGMYASDPGRWAREGGYRAPSTAERVATTDAELEAMGLGPTEDDPDA